MSKHIIICAVYEKHNDVNINELYNEIEDSISISKYVVLFEKKTDPTIRTAVYFIRQYVNSTIDYNVLNHSVKFDKVLHIELDNDTYKLEDILCEMTNDELVMVMAAGIDHVCGRGNDWQDEVYKLLGA